MKEQGNDSTHEDYFEWWLEEAKEAGFVKGWKRANTVTLAPAASIPFTKYMKTKTTEVEKHLYHSLEYTPDYRVVFSLDTAEGILCSNLFEQNSKDKPAFFLSMRDNFQEVSYVDVKPDRFSRQASPSSVTFPIMQKLMWYVHNTYVQKVVLYPATNTQGKNKTLFTQTWTPKKLLEHPDWVYKKDCKFGKKGESRIKWPIRTVEEFLSL